MARFRLISRLSRRNSIEELVNPTEENEALEDSQYSPLAFPGGDCDIVKQVAREGQEAGRS